jgi:hypothetical protein
LFELDEAAVKRVLLQPQVRNRKIAIVSIVGAFRRGKSFLLNFILRYLKAKVCLNFSPYPQSSKLNCVFFGGFCTFVFKDFTT